MFESFGLYTHIEANRRRSALLVAGLFLLVLVVTFATALIARGLALGLPAGEAGTLAAFLRAAARDTLRLSPLSAAGTLLWLWVGYRHHAALVDGLTAAGAVTRGEDPRLHALMENLCIARGLAVPRLKLADDPALNAFATGMNPDQYAVTVTRGLREALDEAELEAVLAHELTHIRNDDVRLMVMAVVVAGAISLFGELMARNLHAFRFGARSSSRERGSGQGSAAVLAVLIGLALAGLAWALAVVIRLALSRSREFLADAGAVELTKNPDALISALLKIEGRGELARAPSGIMELCVDNPRSGWSDLFATHPSIAARVDALVRRAGGRLPPPLPPPAPEAAVLPSPWGRSPG